VARRTVSRRAQRGLALLGLLAVAVMVFAYVLTSRLNAASQFVALDRENNAKLLARAKQALIGYMAQQAAMSGENNPGHLPCPEAPANFGTANEGIEASFCTTQAIGRLPWRTLGLPKLVDAAGEPLWYAVSGGWHRPNSSTNLTLNSDSGGQLSVDGIANDAVALIIAPGPVLAAQAGTGCTAWVQSRPASGAPDLRNYLECENATSPADATFVSSRAGQSFNDQILRVAAADVIPALEAAIAVRMQREIAPALRTVYTSAQYSGIPSSSPMYPYAALFANPNPGLSNNYQGAAGTYQGLLPFSQTQGCDPATDARCTTTLLAWSSGTPPPAYKTGGFGNILNQTCSWQSGGSVALCTGEYEEDNGNPSGAGMLMEMTATINNVAMGLRTLDWPKAQVLARNASADPWLPMTLEPAPDTSATMNADGSVTVKFRARLPNVDAMGWGHKAQYWVSLERAVIGDHFLLDPATTGPGAATSWFVRNEWYRVTYYAAAQANMAAALPSLGCDSSNCLRFNDPSLRNIRALLVLAGRSLSNPAGRPNGALTDYLEYQNADLDTLYEQRPMRMSKVALPALNAPMNDRLVLVDWITPAPSFPLASLP
jgi:hypothetical protein